MNSNCVNQLVNFYAMFIISNIAKHCRVIAADTTKTLCVGGGICFVGR